MHTILAQSFAILSALKNFSASLSAQFDHLAGHSLGTFAIAAIVVTSLVLAAGCGAWALLERARRGNYRQRVQAVLHRSQIACHFRDAILESLPETVVVLRSRSQQALSYGGGSALLQQCLAGPDAAPLATAIDDLLRHAAGFSLSVRLSGLRQVFVRGLRIGNGTALFLRAQAGYGGQEPVRNDTSKIFHFPKAMALRARSGPSPHEDVGSAQPIEASRVGEIVIGADGHLKHYNRAFATQWSFRGDELRGEPRWAEVVERYVARNGRDPIWDIVSIAVTAADPERLNAWGATKRKNGARIWLSVARLKDGSTRMTFTDSILPSATSPYDTTVKAA